MLSSSKSCDSDVVHSHHHKTGYGTIEQPRGTVEYVTSSRDTLRSIAVAFDTTTTSLMKLNRMSSLTVFPGQTLYVPSQPGEISRSPSPPTESEDLASKPSMSDSWGTSFTGEFSFLSPLSPSTSSLRAFKDLVMVSSKAEPKPDRNCNVEMNNHQDTTADRRKAFQASKQEGGVRDGGSHGSLSRSNSDRQRIMSGESTESEPFEEGFLKMAVHYITDTKEMVSGVMLVTPTALMFDPDSDDAVAVRDGLDHYGIMCPMHLMNSIAMYNDISRMTPPSLLSPLKTLSEQTISTNGGDEDTTPEDELSTATTGIDENKDKNGQSDIAADNLNASQHSSSNTAWNAETAHCDSVVTERPPCRKTRPMPGIAKPAFTTNSRDYNSIVENPTDVIVDELIDTSTTTAELPSGGRSAKDEVKLETEFPFIHSIFRTVEDMLPVADATPPRVTEPQRKPSSNHMFLCIRARRPMMKTYSISEDDEATLAQSDNTPERHERLPEYWFQVPRKKSDHVYAFFLQWSPENNPSDDTATQLGFVVMAEEPYPEELNDANQNEKKSRTRTNSSLEFVDDFFDDSYSFEKEWEIISIQEAKRRSIAVNAIELAEADDSLVPELEKPSNLLTESTLLSLCRNLPNRCVGYSWYPVYTTFDHGTSLRTLYRNMVGIEAPCVVLIQDTNDHIFGMLCSSGLHVSDHYYGTGESFLFTMSPDFEVFKWTGENGFFIKGDTDSITFGGGKGTFGLWLDADLLRGCSHPCETFNNKVLSCDEDFLIQSIEVWVIKDM